MKRKRRTISELNQRALDGEELNLHPHDEMVRAHLEMLFDDWRRNLPLSEEDRDLVMTVLEGYVFPPRPGPVPRSEETAEAKAKARAEAIAYGRDYHAKNKSSFSTAAHAWEGTARHLRHHRKDYFGEKETKTIMDELSRRPFRK